MDDPSAPLLVTAEGAVETWTLDLPESRNPVSGDAMIAALVAAVARVDRTPEVRCVILTGRGNAFSAGGNIKDMQEKRGVFGGEAHAQREGYRLGIQQISRAVYHCSVPIVAAVNGPAVGAGCDLAFMCDLRVASESAFFAESFVKLGLIPGDGGAWFLTRVAGAARAAEMVLTGDRVSAAQALEWGLVSRVVPQEQLMETAYELARRVAANPPHAVRMAKKLLREAHGQSLDSALELAAAMQPLAQQTSDHERAVLAMIRRG